MLAALRGLSFVTGALVALLPVYLSTWFAANVGDPPISAKDAAWLVVPLLIGAGLGGGLLLAGLPRVVSGSANPVSRVLAGVLLAISAVLFATFGFGGTVGGPISAAVLLVELLAFAAFVWPAKPFRASSRAGPQPAMPAE